MSRQSGPRGARLGSRALGRPSEKLVKGLPPYRFRRDADEKIVLPPSQALDAKVHADRQPILRRGVGENFDTKDALDAQKRGVLLVVGGVGVGDRCLSDNLKFQVAIKPRRTGKQVVILGKSRPKSR